MEFAGKTGRDNEDSGVHFAAVTPIEPRLFDFLEKGQAVRIESFGARHAVPLKGIKAPLVQMRKACR
jgi:hypothetical protein